MGTASVIIAVPLLRIFPQKINTEQKMRDVLPKALHVSLPK